MPTHAVTAAGNMCAIPKRDRATAPPSPPSSSLARQAALSNGETQSRPSLRRITCSLGIVVASIFFLQYAVERCLVPPNIFPKEEGKRLLEGAQGFYRKTFFRGAIGLSYFFLILYVYEYVRLVSVFLERERNAIAYSVFFLILGLLARARGIILHLSEKTCPANE
jgi:hypothetical protein